MNKTQLPPAIEQELILKKINRELTFSIMNKYNSGALSEPKPIEIAGLPGIDNKNIIDRKQLKTFQFPETHFKTQIQQLLPDRKLDTIGEKINGYIQLTMEELTLIGVLLYPKTAFGILNGGAATSYVDKKKNKAFNPELFNLYEEIFSKCAELSMGKAKGITPAIIQKDGTPGSSFMELKLRGLLIQALRYQILTGTKEKALFPLFQMTSTYNNTQIYEELKNYRESPYLKDLIMETGIPVTETKAGVQPLIAAFTPVESGKPLELYTFAWGKKNSLLPLPGGHGQNFFVLKDIYTGLYKQGKRYVYLGNIDNLGSTVDPVSLALLALSGKQAAFDFSFKTPVDVKGGILIRQTDGRLNCVDLGPAISKEEIEKHEESNNPVLFNCATGIFDLEYLVKNLDMIIDTLPVRFSNQDKDAGVYSQAEQITWEIMGILDDFLVFGVDKYERFLAAKMLIEGIMTSGIKLNDPHFPSGGENDSLKNTAQNLYNGLIKKLTTDYGLELVKGEWVPKSSKALKAEFLSERISGLTLT